MENREGLEGDLSFDSPKVWGHLRSTLDPSSLELISRAYHVASRRGGKREWPIMRPPGASYNPKPARVIEILISIGKIADPIVLAAAALSFAEDLPPDETKDLPPECIAVAKQVIEAPERALPPAGKIIVARLLDEVRHLHMTVLSSEERLAYLRGIRSIVEQMVADPGGDSLRTYFESAVNRYLRGSGNLDNEMP
jgi:hypothetical protein